MIGNQNFLNRFRVLDLSQYIPGPFATRQMADLGADVLKIEPPQGDPMRNFIGSDRDEPSPLYLHLNRGKRILSLDLKIDAGKQTLTRLLTEADVLLESFRPGVMERLGFGRAQLNRINPRLVHCALSGFGQNGPYKARAGHDLTYCAVSGALSLNGTTDQPIISYPPLADHAGALQAVNSILAALLKQREDGQGIFLDISLFESAMSWQYLGLHETEPKRQALMLNGGAAFYNIYETQDGRFLALAALEPKFWVAFCKSLKRETWISRQDDPLPQHELITELGHLFRRHPLHYWNEKLIDVECCYEPIPSIKEVATHPQVRFRGLLHGFEPSYPAWINDNPVALGKPMIKLSDPEKAVWL